MVILSQWRRLRIVRTAPVRICNDKGPPTTEPAMMQPCAVRLLLAQMFW